MYPFDLERALAGEECFYRSEHEGEDIKIINVFDSKDGSLYPISIIYLVVHENAKHKWFIRGNYESQGLFMKYPPKENKEEIKTAPFDLDYALKGHALIKGR